MSAPSRLARWLLTRRLPPEDREDILLNLEELHRHHARRRGRWFATAWYWRDALVFAVRFGRARGAGGPAPARVGATFADSTLPGGWASSS